MSIDPSSYQSTQSNASQRSSRYVSSGFMRNGRSISSLFPIGPTENNSTFPIILRSINAVWKIARPIIESSNTMAGESDNLNAIDSFILNPSNWMTVISDGSLAREISLNANFSLDGRRSSKEKLAEPLIPSFQQAKNLIEQKYPEKIASIGPGVVGRINNLGFLQAIRSGVDLAPLIKEAATDGSEVIKETKKNLKELHLKFVNAYQELIETEVLTAEAFQMHVIDGGKGQDEKMQDVYKTLRHFVQTILLQDRIMENILTEAAYRSS